MLAQKLILSYSSKIVIQIIQIAASIIVARIAGPTVLGTVAFGLAFVSIFAFIADLGIGSAHMKLVSEGQDVGACISTYSVLKVANTLLFVIVVLGLFLIQKHVLNVQFESTAHEYVIIILLVAITVQQLLNIPIRTFAAKTEQAKQDIPEFIRILLYQILRIVLVVVGYRAVALAFGNLVSTLLVIPIILWLFRDYPRGKFDKSLARRYILLSLPILIMGMSTNVVFHLDKVCLQYFTGSEQVGFYTAGYKIGSLIFMIANSVGLLFFPTFSKAASNGNFAYIKTTIEKFERFSLLFIMPMVIFVSIFSDVIIKVLLGSEYLPSVPAMAIINIAMFAMVLNMPYGNVLTGMGYFKLAAVLNVLNLVLFAALSFALPNPKLLNLGATGMAITVFLSNLFVGFLYRFYAKRKCPILRRISVVKLLSFGVVSFGGFYIVYAWLSNVYGTPFKVVFIVLYFLITYSALVFARWINRDDLNNLLQIANVRKIGSYIRGELKRR